MASPTGPSNLPAVPDQADTVVTNTPVPQPPQFDTVEHGGLHPDQVHRYIHGLLGELTRLQHEVARHIPGMARDAEHVAEAVARTPQGKLMIVDLMKIAVDEIERNRQQAQADADQLLRDAKAEAEQIMLAARSQAGETMTGASQQAAAVLDGARTEAKGMTDQAALKQAAVEETAGRRLSMVDDTHKETIRRLEEIHRVTGGLLDAEKDRGSLADDVNAALPDGVTVTPVRDDPEPEVAAAAEPVLTATADNDQPRRSTSPKTSAGKG
jgi:hypothetical protein